jgi:egghead protein (zeste-white 4 protein)
MSTAFGNRMYFRIVTRGMHPRLVRENALCAIRVLDACLDKHKYCLEVVTDNAIDAFPFLQEHFQSIHADFDLAFSFREIVVDAQFKCMSGAKYKARALQYAILNSNAGRTDWIVHLDEETKFDADTVRQCLHHCLREDLELASGKKTFGNVGQGVIIYGAQLTIENYITTLADSIRVGDDFGKFRLQYQSHYPWIGMHGSFVVCSNAVEREISFDHGLSGSITEDAYFALAAWARDIKFSWVDGFMYEQSPFTLKDFCMQRRRWFGGYIVQFLTLFANYVVDFG